LHLLEGCERTGETADGENNLEPDPPHGNLVGDGWRESIRGAQATVLMLDSSQFVGEPMVGSM